ncbi:glutathione S-transferase U10-like [Rhodamnia argentea]|uniref:glutathione transferase n=1 Tax=Rhodamnia argentea TaxID=178133 RepID=A0A8B8N7R6_9MYRT|nr:glutathione S-transferase U10-like [Rhodamnia argentea]
MSNLKLRDREAQREREREMAGRVVLHGMWASPYSMSVKLGLKVKGVEYEYVEEDLMNKSEVLLRLNPVHKKIPVLVHNGKPIAESLVIVEYIEETWKEGPPLLPQDPYERAKVRFWAGFLQRQLFEAMFSVVITDGEAQARAVKEGHEKLAVLEEGIKGGYPGGSPFISGGNLGLLDIVVCSILGAHKVHEEVLGVTYLDSEKYPRVTSWVKSLTELPLVKEAMPPNEKLVDFFQFFRARALESAAA